MFTAEIAPQVDHDKIPRELTVKAGKDVDIDIPYKGMGGRVLCYYIFVVSRLVFVLSFSSMLLEPEIPGPYK